MYFVSNEFEIKNFVKNIAMPFNSALCIASLLSN